MNPVEDSSSQTFRADIVIVGAGGAGLAAAAAAAEKGIKHITILEARRVPYGNAVFPDGIFAAESPLQKRLGIDARKDDIFKKAMSYAHWKINPRLVRALVNKSGDTIRWLEEKGVEFVRVDPIYPSDTPLSFHVSKGPGKTGAAVVRALFRSCERQGVEILYQTKAKKLITDRKGGVIGVLSEVKGKEIRIMAKSVILATGGFSGDQELLKKYLPTYEDREINHTGMPRAGDGLRMATEIGATVEGMVALEILGPFIEPKYLPFIVRSPETLWVNKKGERFTDEAVTFLFTEAANCIFRQPGKISYTIFDEKIKQGILENLLLTHKTRAIGIIRELQFQESQGKVKMSNSWDEIAQWMGAAPEVLKRTIDEYNSFCDHGHDEDFAKDQRYLLSMHTPPYVAVQCGIDCVATHGGIKVNHKMEVLNLQDNLIGGLYAAGVEIGGTESDTYNANLPGHSFGFTINSGRIAGENAAQFVFSL